jgi:hypothetical protein
MNRVVAEQLFIIVASCRGRQDDQFNSLQQREDKQKTEYHNKPLGENCHVKPAFGLIITMGELICRFLCNYPHIEIQWSQ